MITASLALELCFETWGGFRTCGHCASRTRGKFACACHWQVVLLCRAGRTKDPLCLDPWALPVVSDNRLSYPACLLSPGKEATAPLCQAQRRHRLTKFKRFEGCSGVTLFPRKRLQLLKGFVCSWLLQFSPFTLKMWSQPASHPADWQGSQRASGYCAMHPAEALSSACV